MLYKNFVYHFLYCDTYSFNWFIWFLRVYINSSLEFALLSCNSLSNYFSYKRSSETGIGYL